MIGQLQIGMDGSFLDKVDTAIRRLKAFEPEEGYFLSFSGGKDSQCIYHLAKMAGVRFDAHYTLTSVDPPELVYFIRRNYPDVVWDIPRDENGKHVTMWSLIASNTMPPTRRVRYCCSKLKEPGGEGRVVVTGVRWAESSGRAQTHGVVGFRGKPVATGKLARKLGADFATNKSGEIIMNDDNDPARRLVESCYRTRKTMVNPIVDWEDEDVWEFLNGNGIPHCSLYDEGFTRLGCIGCPLAGSDSMRRDFERWPKYKAIYVRAFQRMLDNHPGEIQIYERVDDVQSGRGGQPPLTTSSEAGRRLEGRKQSGSSRFQRCSDGTSIFRNWLSMGAS